MNYFEIPAISNSSLSTFSYDPSYYHKVYVTKELVDKKESSALTMGSVIHCLLLEPDEFEKRYVVSTLGPEAKPSGMMLEFVNILAQADVADEIAIEAAYRKSGYKISQDKVLESFKAPAIQAYYNELIASKGKTLLQKSEYEHALKCVEISENNPQWIKILDYYTWNSYRELEIFWEDGGLQFKSKLDLLYVRRAGSDLFIKYFDYKTDSQKAVHKYMETFEFWRTYRQMAFYKEAIHQWVKQNFKDIDNVHISMYIAVIDTVRLKSLIYVVDKSYLMKGLQEIKQDIDNLKWHYTFDRWEFPRHVYEALDFSGVPSLTDTEYYNKLGIKSSSL